MKHPRHAFAASSSTQIVEVSDDSERRARKATSQTLAARPRTPIGLHAPIQLLSHRSVFSQTPPKAKKRVRTTSLTVGMRLKVLTWRTTRLCFIKSPPSCLLPPATIGLSRSIPLSCPLPIMMSLPKLAAVARLNKSEVRGSEKSYD